MYLERLIQQKCSLEQLLNHDQVLDYIQQGQHQVIINYLCQNRQMIFQMIQQITTLSNVQHNKKVSHLHPYIISEIFEMKFPEISKVIIDDNQLMDAVFGFTQQPEELNHTLAGYYSKLVNGLLMSNFVKVVAYIYGRKNILKTYVTHIYNMNIADLLKKILYFHSSFQRQLGGQSQYLMVKEEVMRQMLLVLDSNDHNAQSQVLLLISELILQFANVIDSLKMIAIIFQNFESYCAQFLAQRNTRNNIEMIQQCTIFYSLIKYENIEQYQSLFSQPQFTSFCKSFVKYLPQIHNSLSHFDRQRKMQNGATIRMSGQERICFTEIITDMFVINDKEVVECILKNKIVHTIMNYLNDYPWNNILHQVIEHCFINILSISDPTVVENLFVQYKIYQFFVDQCQNLQLQSNNRNQFKYNKGNIGYLISIINRMNAAPAIQPILYKSAIWREFCEKQLNVFNFKSQIQILDINLRQNIDSQLKCLVSKKSLNVEQIQLIQAQEQGFLQDQFIEISKEIDDHLNGNQDSDQESIAEEVENSQPITFNVSYLDDKLTDVKFRPINDDDRAFFSYLNYEPASNNFIQELIRTSSQDI